MEMDALLRQSPTAAYIADRLGEDLFTVIDVGCSGGHLPGWRALGAHFRAIGFDPQRYEIARLRAAETNPLVEYVEGYVGPPADHPLRKLHPYDVYWSRSPWFRLAPARSHALTNDRPVPDYLPGEAYDEATPDIGLSPFGSPRPLEERRRSASAQEEIALQNDNVLDAAAAEHQLRLQETNRWHEAELADEARQIVLPEYLAARGISDIDFLKIDVDGPDYDILYTMSDAITEGHVLGVSLEVNFNGSHLPHHHTFHNMDRFMRAHGFALFALTVRNYSSAALPQPYVMPHAAQSIRGRPLQGDALYVRDFGLRIPESDARVVSDEKLAKTAILLAMFDLPAEAVEHVQRFRERLSRLFDVDEAIALLTRESQREEKTDWTYAEYMAAFQAGDPFFLNRQLAPAYDPETRQGDHPQNLAYAFARERQAAAEQADTLRQRAEAAQAAAEAEVDRLRAEVERLKAAPQSRGFLARLRGRSARGG